MKIPVSERIRQTDALRKAKMANNELLALYRKSPTKRNQVTVVGCSVHFNSDRRRYSTKLIVLHETITTKHKWLDGV